jgi:xanthine dehydrogenase accessory factor
MSFDRSALIAACRQHGRVARVVVALVRGSAPREVGAAMLVWADGTSGTIGGGTLEHEATQAARRDLTPGRRHLSAHALGPDLGQCCGGAVDLLTEVYDLSSAEALPDDIIVRGSGEMPLAVHRLLAGVRNGSAQMRPRLESGWMLEPVLRPERNIWIWGAGHVGRALVSVLHPLPQVSLTWVDIDAARFPETCPEPVEIICAQKPETLVDYAPTDAEHLIVTYSHALDLALCHALLSRGFRFAGLIGSTTKWARFRKRLIALGHSPETTARITCPIGDKSLGKHPQAIALGVGSALLVQDQGHTKMEDTA